jgi:predicted Kef-type K+ transport protein
MGAMGYTARTGFLAGLTVAQISEFSLVFTALGVSLGHVPRRCSGSSRWWGSSRSRCRPT